MAAGPGVANDVDLHYGGVERGLQAFAEKPRRHGGNRVDVLALSGVGADRHGPSGLHGAQQRRTAAAPPAFAAGYAGCCLVLASSASSTASGRFRQATLSTHRTGRMTCCHTGDGPFAPDGEGGASGAAVVYVTGGEAPVERHQDVVRAGALPLGEVREGDRLAAALAEEHHFVTDPRGGQGG